MAGQKPAEKADPEHAPANPAPAQLGKAGESSDPVVHGLLARREIALRNGDTGAADALTAELKELGVGD